MEAKQTDNASRMMRNSAIHEAGHAVAALAGKWVFDHIHIVEDFQESRHGGRLVWHNAGPLVGPAFAKQQWQLTFRPEVKEIYGVEWRANVICCALAGAFAVRHLCRRSRRPERYPSNTDLQLLVDAGHYPPEAVGCANTIRRRPYGDRESASRLDQILEPDAANVAGFLERSAAQISAVGEALIARVEHISYLRWEARLDFDDVWDICGYPMPDRGGLDDVKAERSVE